MGINSLEEITDMTKNLIQVDMQFGVDINKEK